MNVRYSLLLAGIALGLACESTPNIDDPLREGELVTIPPDDLEPVVRFFLQTNRMLAAEFVRIEMTPQFFEDRMGFTRDPRYVERKSWRDRKGRRIIQIRNVNRTQKTNVDPDLLPRVYFGSGLEIRAYDTIRIIMTNPKTRERPVHIDIVAKNSTGDAKLWVSGRLQDERPTLRLSMALIWSEKRERWLPKTFVG